MRTAVIHRPVVALAFTLLLAAGCSSQSLPAATPSPAPTVSPTPSPDPAAAAATYVAHVDAAAATMNAQLVMPAATDSDRLTIYSTVTGLTGAELSWIGIQRVPACLTTAASQYAATITALQSAMNLGVEAFTAADSAAMSVATTQAQKGRLALVSAQQAVDAAGAAC